ncbi:MAG: calcium-binding protein [Actinomycetota bacterium]
MRRISIVALSGALCLLIAQPAGAATTATSSTVLIEGYTLRLTAARNVANDVSVEPGESTGSYLVSDSAGVDAGAGCTSLSGTSAMCAGDLNYIVVVVSDLADNVTIGTLAGPMVSIQGGGGKDTITSHSAAGLNGGGGNDTLTGSTFRDGLGGGPGDDQLNGMGGPDYLIGGLGADVIDGGKGADIASYVERLDGVHISSDGITDDGTPGEGDNVINAEYLIGGEGNDTIVTSSTAAGRGGNDALSFAPGGSGVLSGGTGNDTLTAGGAFSTIRGQQGDDTLMSKNGHGDSDICNSGTDSVTADASDSVASDCELVTT